MDAFVVKWCAAIVPGSPETLPWAIATEISPRSRRSELTSSDDASAGPLLDRLAIGTQQHEELLEVHVQCHDRVTGVLFRAIRVLDLRPDG